MEWHLCPQILPYDSFTYMYLEEFLMWVYFSSVLSDVLIHDLTCNRVNKISKISIKKLSEELRPRSMSKLACMLSLQSHLTLATLWTVACQAPLSMMISKQEYWRELSFPSLGDLLYPGIKPVSPALAGGFSTTGPPEKPRLTSTFPGSEAQKTLHTEYVFQGCL